MLFVARRRAVPAVFLGAAAALLAACGHVPVSSLPSLMRIDFKTTNLGDLRATILIPAEIMPLPGTAKLTIKVTGGGGDHERQALLEEVTDKGELATLPQPVPADMRMIAYRLPPMEAAKLNVFRSEIMAETGTTARRNLTIGIGIDKFCHTAPLREGPAYMTSYLRTSETRSHVVLTRNVDLKALAAEAKIDTDKVLTPCKS
jgi:hypothetical protein